MSDFEHRNRLHRLESLLKHGFTDTASFLLDMDAIKVGIDSFDESKRRKVFSAIIKSYKSKYIDVFGYGVSQPASPESATTENLQPVDDNPPTPDGYLQQASPPPLAQHPVQTPLTQFRQLSVKQECGENVNDVNSSNNPTLQNNGSSSNSHGRKRKIDGIDQNIICSLKVNKNGTARKFSESNSTVTSLHFKHHSKNSTTKPPAIKSETTTNPENAAKLETKPKIKIIGTVLKIDVERLVNGFLSEDMLTQRYLENVKIIQKNTKKNILKKTKSKVPRDFVKLQDALMQFNPANKFNKIIENYKDFLNKDLDATLASVIMDYDDDSNDLVYQTASILVNLAQGKPKIGDALFDRGIIGNLVEMAEEMIAYYTTNYYGILQCVVWVIQNLQVQAKVTDKIVKKYAGSLIPIYEHMIGRSHEEEDEPFRNDIIDVIQKTCTSKRLNTTDFKLFYHRLIVNPSDKIDPLFFIHHFVRKVIVISNGSDRANFERIEILQTTSKKFLEILKKGYQNMESKYKNETKNLEKYQKSWMDAILDLLNLCNTRNDEDSDDGNEENCPMDGTSNTTANNTDLEACNKSTVRENNRQFYLKLITACTKLTFEKNPSFDVKSSDLTKKYRLVQPVTKEKVELIEKLFSIDPNFCCRYVAALAKYVIENEDRISDIKHQIFYILESFKTVSHIQDSNKFSWSLIFDTHRAVLSDKNVFLDNFKKILEGLNAYIRGREFREVSSTEDTWFSILSDKLKKSKHSKNELIKVLRKLSAEKMPDTDYF